MPQLDRAQFAIDGNLAIVDDLAPQIANLAKLREAGNASPEQIEKLEQMKQEVIVAVERIGDIGNRVLAGDPSPHLRKI